MFHIIWFLWLKNTHRLHYDWKIPKATGPNISIGYWKISGKRSSYIRRKLLHLQRTQLPNVKLKKIPTSSNSEAFGKHIPTLFCLFLNTVIISLLIIVFVIFKTVKCVSVKRFYIDALLFSALLGTASLLKNFTFIF